jgi:hypothetical protein
MNRRLIEKVILKKHLEFVASIGDEKVRDLVAKNAIITGGAIVSLLTNDPVNDYDYYFEDFETTLAVAKYYIDQFIELNKGKITIEPKLWWELPKGDLPGCVKIIVQSAGIASEAGDEGYKYFESLPDEYGMEYVDKVTKAADDLDQVPPDGLDDAQPPYRPVFMSANAITLSNKVQCVIRFFGDPGEIHKNYDFIHCCNYWTPDGGLVLNAAALESILSKNLIYQGSLYPVCSVIRMRKFMKQGWYINAGQILKMLFQVSQLDLTNMKVLEDQLTGVDAAYFHQLIEYCKQRAERDKDFKVTMPYLISVIDKIFG